MTRLKRPLRKTAKLLLLRAAKSLGLFAFSRVLSRKAVRILCYHGTWLGDPAFGGDAMFMRARTFEGRLDFLKRKHYEVVPLSVALEALSGGAPPLRDAVVITIDDGWYSTFRDMLPALRARSMTATIFCDTAQLLAKIPVPHVMARYLALASGRNPREPMLASAHRVATDLSRPKHDRLRSARRLAELLGIDVRRCLEDRIFDYMTTDELRQAAAAGFGIELHTHNHSLGDMSAPVVVREVEENRRALASILDCSPQAFTHLCYPSGLFSAEVGSTLGALGVSSATTLIPGLASQRSPPHALPRFCDGEGVTELEFEAELCGFNGMVRAAVRVAQGR